MDHAILLCVEQSKAHHVQVLWKDVAKNVGGRGPISTQQIDFDYRPHVTLAAGKGIDPRQIEFGLEKFAGEWDAQPVTFHGLLVKPPALLVLPVLPQWLKDRQRSVFNSIPLWAEVAPHYRPDGFIGHITVARDLNSGYLMSKAIQRVFSDWQPFTATLDRLAIISYDSTPGHPYKTKEVWGRDLKISSEPGGAR